MIPLPRSFQTKKSSKTPEYFSPSRQKSAKCEMLLHSEKFYTTLVAPFAYAALYLLPVETLSGNTFRSYSASLTNSTQPVELSHRNQEGIPMSKLLSGLSVVALSLSLALGGAGSAAAQTKLLNVSYDPTRELYKDFNEAFAKK